MTALKLHVTQGQTVLKLHVTQGQTVLKLHVKQGQTVLKLASLVASILQGLAASLSLHPTS